MARKKKQTDEAAGGEPAPAKSKSNLVPAIVVAVGLLGGGYFMSGGGGGKAASAGADAATTATTEKHEKGVLEQLDSVTINLADGRFLKLGIALEVKEKKGGGGHGGGGESEFAKEAPLALDQAITLFGDKTYAQLAAPGGREAAKAELTERVKHVYEEGRILAVYFTEFVMQ